MLQTEDALQGPRMIARDISVSTTSVSPPPWSVILKMTAVITQTRSPVQVISRETFNYTDLLDGSAQNFIFTQVIR